MNIPYFCCPRPHGNGLRFFAVFVNIFFYHDRATLAVLAQTSCCVIQAMYERAIDPTVLGVMKDRPKVDAEEELFY
jgi:hypothetical protein